MRHLFQIESDIANEQATVMLPFQGRWRHCPTQLHFILPMRRPVPPAAATNVHTQLPDAPLKKISCVHGARVLSQASSFVAPCAFASFTSALSSM